MAMADAGFDVVAGSVVSATTSSSSATSAVVGGVVVVGEAVALDVCSCEGVGVDAAGDFAED